MGDRLPIEFCSDDAAARSENRMDFSKTGIIDYDYKQTTYNPPSAMSEVF